MDKIPVSKLFTWNLAGTRVFLRVDLNVALSDEGKILDDFRLHSILPTIDTILRAHGKVILATHIGRPKEYTPSLSTRTLVPWFEQQGYKIVFEDDLQRAQEKSHTITDTILLLENLRFFPGEKKSEISFARQLKTLSDFYVNDAFALLHRNDTSITLLPKLFDQDKRSIGPLVEQELKILSNIRNNPAHPYLLIVGGGKVKDKIPYLWNFLDKVDSIALCPALVFTFMQAQGISVGKSLIAPDIVEQTKDFLHAAQKKNVRILFPIDYLIARDNLHGPLSICTADQIPANAFGIAIGPKTIQTWAPEIKKAETIFLNAAMGMLDQPKTIEPLKELLYVIANSSTYSVIGGGESVAIVKKFHLEYGINYLSTAGGAALCYVGGQELPGIDKIYR